MAAGGPQQLSDVIAGLLRALVRARGAMDSASSELAKAYWADPILRSLPLPAFTMPQVKVRLKFAVAGLVTVGSGGERATPAADMRVIVELPALEKVPAHLISELELNLTPQMLRAFEEEGEGVPGAKA